MKLCRTQLFRAGMEDVVEEAEKQLRSVNHAMGRDSESRLLGLLVQPWKSVLSGEFDASVYCPGMQSVRLDKVTKKQKRELFKLVESLEKVYPLLWQRYY